MDTEEIAEERPSAEEATEEPEHDSGSHSNEGEDPLDESKSASAGGDSAAESAPAQPKRHPSLRATPQKRVFEDIGSASPLKSNKKKKGGKKKK